MLFSTSLFFSFDDLTHLMQRINRLCALCARLHTVMSVMSPIAWQALPHQLSRHWLSCARCSRLANLHVTVSKTRAVLVTIFGFRSIAIDSTVIDDPSFSLCSVASSLQSLEVLLDNVPEWLLLDTSAVDAFLYTCSVHALKFAYRRYRLFLSKPYSMD